MANTSKTHYAALGLLTTKPMSGYEIKKTLINSTNYFWSESNGQLYPTLTKLAENGLVTVKKEQEKGKTRKIYTITSAGKEVLEEWLLEDVQHYPRRNELLLKLFFGHNVSKKVSIQHIEKHLTMCEQLLAQYMDIEKRLEKNVKAGESPVYYLLTLKSGLSVVRSQIEWCHESIKLINKYDKSSNENAKKKHVTRK